MKDSDGNELQAGAMYCCADSSDDGTTNYNELVRFIGYQNVCGENYPVFANADTWEDCTPMYESLVRQRAPVIDPASQGWGKFVSYEHTEIAPHPAYTSWLSEVQKLCGIEANPENEELAAMHYFECAPSEGAEYLRKLAD